MATAAADEPAGVATEVHASHNLEPKWRRILLLYDDVKYDVNNDDSVDVNYDEHADVNYDVHPSHNKLHHYYKPANKPKRSNNIKNKL